MAELIGLIASVLSILQGVKEAKAFLKANVHTTSSLRSELGPLLGWLTAFEGLLRGLQLECILDESDTGRLRVLSHIAEPLTACEKALTTIVARLNRSIKIGKWFISVGNVLDKETSAALQVLYQAKPILDLALLADQRTLLKSIETYMRVVAEDVQNLRLESQSHYEEQKSLQSEHENLKTRVEILKWISQIDYKSNLSAALNRVLPGDIADQWFFRHPDFVAWASSGDKFQGILLAGQSGAGKTVISAKVIKFLTLGNEVDLDRGADVLYYFFDFNDAAKQNVEGMIRSLIHQLVSRSDEIPSNLIKLFRGERNDRSSTTVMSINDWFDALKALFKTMPPQYVVIDALDECAEADEYLLESFLRDLSSSDDLKVRWMATRRRSQNASGPELLQMDLEAQNVREIRMVQFLVNGDIRQYLNARLETDPGLVSFSSQTKALIIHRILEKSSGMFRFAQCQLDSICRLKDRRLKQVAKALDTMPTDIFDTYNRILATLQSPNERILAARILLLVCYSAHPVSVREAAEFAILEDEMDSISPDDRFGDCTDILLLLGSLIDINYGILSLSHRSVQEYLVSGQGNALQHSQEISDLFKSDEEADVYIGRRCLQYIGFGHQWQRDKDKQDVMPNAKHLTKLLSEFPFLDYAARKWPHHLSRKTTQILLSREIQSTLPLTAAPNLWKAYILLQPADIWQNQLALSQLLCEVSLRAATAYDWSRDFWETRQLYRVTHEPKVFAGGLPTDVKAPWVGQNKTNLTAIHEAFCFNEPSEQGRRFFARATSSIQSQSNSNMRTTKGELMVVTTNHLTGKWTATTEKGSGCIESTQFELSGLFVPQVMGVPFYYLAILLIEIALQKPLQLNSILSFGNVTFEEQLRAHILAFDDHVRAASRSMGETYGELISKCLKQVTVPSETALLQLYARMVAFMEDEGCNMHLIHNSATELFMTQDAKIDEISLPLQGMIRGGFRASRQIRPSFLADSGFKAKLAKALEDNEGGKEEQSPLTESSLEARLLVLPPKDMDLGTVKETGKKRFRFPWIKNRMPGAAPPVPLHHKPVQRKDESGSMRWSASTRLYSDEPVQPSGPLQASRWSAAAAAPWDRED